MPYSLIELLWLFVIYAFLGWCGEVIFATFETGKFVNRGFLSGPVCPIYGFGVIFVILLLTPLKDHLFLLFLGSIVITSVLELLTGYLLEKFFHDKWWDYSKRPFNLRGYICLEFSILWGFACLLVVHVIHPLIMRMIQEIPMQVSVVVLSIIAVFFLMDCAVTLTVVLKLKRRLRAMEEITQRLRKVSDKIGEELSGGVQEAMKKGREGRDEVAERTGKLREGLAEKKEEWLEKRAEHKDETEGLRTLLAELSRQKILGQKRLLKAFPRLQNGKHQDVINKIHHKGEDDEK